MKKYVSYFAALNKFLSSKRFYKPMLYKLSDLTWGLKAEIQLDTNYRPSRVEEAFESTPSIYNYILCFAVASSSPKNSNREIGKGKGKKVSSILLELTFGNVQQS